jgi:Holliday junction resolvasome RuvABC endonuclease subunit
LTPSVVGLDLSLTATGFAHENASGVLTTKLRGMERLADLRERVRQICIGADLVVIENYSFNSRQGGEHLGELGGVVRLMLHETEHPYVELSPAKLKKLATGKGNANKSEVLAAAIRRLDYPGANDNESDAMWLRVAGLIGLGFAPVELPLTHLAALDDVTWPALVGVS